MSTVGSATVDAERSAVDAGVVAALVGAVERLRHRRILSAFVLITQSVPPDLPASAGSAVPGAPWESVLDGIDVVLLHDPADALDLDALAPALIAAVRDGAAVAVPVLPVTDTIKTRTSDGLLRSTVDRDVLRRIATPWACSADLLHGPIPARLPEPWQFDRPVVPVEAAATVRS